MNIHTRTWEIVETARAGDQASRAFDIAMLSLITLNVIAIIISTVESIYAVWGPVLDAFEQISLVVFAGEYVARLWSCTADPRYQQPVLGRLRFALKPLSILDLLVILPLLLGLFNVDLRSLRALRLFRILRIVKIGRYATSLNQMQRVLSNKKEELVLTSILIVLLLIITSTLLYYVENPAQPELFASIPHTMWWAIATLTTVGYGDVYPVTLAGRLLAGVTALLGVGLVALPAGILGSGFVEAIQQTKAKQATQTCPHCGKEFSA